MSVIQTFTLILQVSTTTLSDIRTSSWKDKIALQMVLFVVGGSIPVSKNLFDLDIVRNDCLHILFLLKVAMERR